MQLVEQMGRELKFAWNVSYMPSQDVEGLVDSYYTDMMVNRLQQLGDGLIDVADYLLQVVNETDHGELKRILAESGSAWTVFEDGDGVKQLVRVVSEEMSSMAQEVVSSGLPGSVDLGAAWSFLYGRQPEVQSAYKHALLALEAAIATRTLKKDAKASLGKAASHIFRTDSWTMGFERTPDPNGERPVPLTQGKLLASILFQLQAGEVSRHRSGETQEAELTFEAAESAVALATALLHMVRGGSLKPIAEE
ncbi:hypothetical protein [Galactobacter valiniphilus]|uniref:hypothetical protein n=1 Tax=Galactobacter valiniphilus TaxID=2676122 RepID=UPI003734E799